MRFITVKDITKVDKRCVSSTNDADNDVDFTDYLVKAKENVATKLKEVSLDPGFKNSYISQYLKELKWLHLAMMHAIGGAVAITKYIFITKMKMTIMKKL